MYHLYEYRVVSEKAISPELEGAIIEAAMRIMYRAQSAQIKCNREDILIYYNDSSDCWFVLGNPILYWQEIFDTDGKFLEKVPIRNISLEYQDQIIQEMSITSEGAYKVKYSLPRVLTLIPELCIRISQ